MVGGKGRGGSSTKHQHERGWGPNMSVWLSLIQGKQGKAPANISELGNFLELL